MEQRAPIDHAEFRARLREFGIAQIEVGSVLAESSEATVRGLRVALDRAGRPAERLTEATRMWLQEGLRFLASKPSSDGLRSLAAEVEAGLRLAWIGPVERVPETKSPTTDFKVGDLHVEVFCPQEHTTEREVVEADLAQQLERAVGPVKVAVALSHPTIGSGRKLDRSGAIQRDPQSKALEFPANKLIDRLLHAKRDARQFRDGDQNILWLDLKHGLRMSAVDCLPFRSLLAKGECYIGTHGIWHAFYAESGLPHFPERATLEWPIGYVIYAQQARGWFRDAPKVSALFENPWANVLLTDRNREEVYRLSEFRPEFCWTECVGTLKADVSAVVARMSWMARLAEQSELSEPVIQESLIEADKP